MFCYRVYNRAAYMEEGRSREREPWMEIREREHAYGEERRERTLAGRADWKSNQEWESAHNSQREWAESAGSSSAIRGRGGYMHAGMKRGGLAGSAGKTMLTMQHSAEEPDWDAEESETGKADTKRMHANFAAHSWDEQNAQQSREKQERRWPLAGSKDWRDSDDIATSAPTLARLGLHRGRGRGFRRGGLEHATERVGIYRAHAPPALMNLNVQSPNAFHNSNNPRFALNRNMTYTNPNIIKKQAAAKAAAQASAATAVAAAKAAAQSAASATTNPGIFGQVRHQVFDEKPEAGEVIADSDNEKADKAAGELSEISDSDDDILNKTEKKTKTEDSLDKEDSQESGITKQLTANPEGNDETEIKTADDDEMLDSFEEISDGELEEDSRHKGSNVL